MNIDNFEDRIKEAFGRHRPATDNDAIWENIEPHLKKKKKRRAIIFFWWGLGLGVLMLFWWISEREPAAPPRASSATEKRVVSPPEKAAQDKMPAFPTPEKTATKPRGQNKATNTGGSVTRFAKKPAAVPQVKPFPADNSVAIEFAGTAENSGPKTTNAIITESPVSERRPAEASKSAIPMSVEIRHNAVPETAAPEIPENDTPGNREVAANEEPGNSGFTGKGNPEKPVNIEKENTTPERSEKEVNEKTDKKTSKDKPKEPGKKRKKRKFKWEEHVSVQAGPALAVRQLRARSGLSDPADGYLAGRKSTEKSLESFTAGFFYSATTRKGLVLKAGLDYRQTNEKFHLAFTETEILQLNGVLTVTVDGSGNIIGQTTGPKTITKTTEYANTAYNHYRFVNLPIGIGHRQAGKKSHWELSAGVDINLFFRAAGTIYNRFNEPTPLKGGNMFYDEVFRRSTGLGGWASFAYGRKLTDKLRWQVSANVQMPLSPVTKTDYELEQRYFNFGVQAGVVYQVKKL